MAPFADTDNDAAIQTYFIKLAARLGKDWTAAIVPKGHIAFSHNTFRLNEAYLWAAKNATIMRSLEYDKSDLYHKKIILKKARLKSI